MPRWFHDSLSPLRALLVLCLVGSSACSDESFRERARDDDEVILLDMNGTSSPDMVPSPSDDPRCAEVTCSGHGSCQIIAAEPTCQCALGYRTTGLDCEAVPAGAPQFRTLAPTEVRLTQDESFNFVMNVSYEQSATLSMRLPAERGEPAEELFSFTEKEHGTFEFELSWQVLNELVDGLDVEGEERVPLELYLEDAMGRSASQLFELVLHCDGRGGSACDGVCTDLMSDVQNCGSCGARTPADAACIEGARVCENADLVACNAGCVPNDVMNCGGCGNVCSGVEMTCHSNFGGFCHQEQTYEELNTFGAMASDEYGGLYIVSIHGSAEKPTSTHYYYTGGYGGLTELPGPPLPSAIPAQFDSSDEVLAYNPYTSAFFFAYEIAPDYDQPAEVYLQVMRRGDAGDMVWGSAERVSSILYEDLKGDDTITLQEDGASGVWLAYRSSQGVEVFHKTDASAPIVHHGTYIPPHGVAAMHDVSFHRDLERGVNHLVYALGFEIHHARQERDGVWHHELITTTQAQYDNNLLSPLRGDDSGTLYLLHRKDDVLLEMIYTPGSGWMFNNYVTPSAPPARDIRHDPRPHAFEVDEHGNRWLYILLSSGQHSGSGIIGLQTKMWLFHSPAGHSYWTSQFITGGERYSGLINHRRML